MNLEMTNMTKQRFRNQSRLAGTVLASFAILAMWATTGAHPGLAQQSAQPTFPSAAEASQMLFQAVQSNNGEAIANVLGGPTELASSHDDAQDTTDRQMFIRKYQEMHRLGRETDGSVTLYIGAENWPFPVSLVVKNGAWRFDSEAGLKEVLFRRIGVNELAAIATCHEFVAAENKHLAKSNITDHADISPDSLVARAASGSPGGDPILLHGYYFRVLATPAKRGNVRGTQRNTAAGFAFIAYPAEYRSSGVMTFVVAEDDVVYEKDLGVNTSSLASAMATYHAKAGWHAAEE
jgi:hypothetical protein